jgi:hypothetical protein
MLNYVNLNTKLVSNLTFQTTQSESRV